MLEDDGPMTTAIIYTVALVFLAGLIATIVERTEERDMARDFAGDELARINAAHDAEANLLAAVVRQAAQDLAASEAACVQLDQENMRLHCELTEAQIAAGTVRIPSLRVVRP